MSVQRYSFNYSIYSNPSQYFCFVFFILEDGKTTVTTLFDVEILSPLSDVFSFFASTRETSLADAPLVSPNLLKRRYHTYIITNIYFKSSFPALAASLKLSLASSIVKLAGIFII